RRLTPPPLPARPPRLPCGKRGGLHLGLPFLGGLSASRLPSALCSCYAPAPSSREHPGSPMAIPAHSRTTEHDPADTSEETLSASVNTHRGRGRAAGLNMAGRYEKESRDSFDDGWGTLEDLPPLKTHVQEERARTI